MPNLIISFERRNDQPDPLVIADGVLRKLDGNPRPYFSLTGNVYRSRRQSEADLEAWGACGDRLVEVWPDLKGLEALHLSDDRGVPMHAVENGYYWLGFTRYVKWDDTQDEYGHPRDCPTIVARHFRISRDEAIELHDRLVDIGESVDDSLLREISIKSTLKAWVGMQLPRWDEEARTVLRETFGAEYRVLRFDEDPSGVTVSVHREGDDSGRKEAKRHGWFVDDLSQ